MKRCMSSWVNKIVSTGFYWNPWKFRHCCVQTKFNLQGDINHQREAQSTAIYVPSAMDCAVLCCIIYHPARTAENVKQYKQTDTWTATQPDGQPDSWTESSIPPLYSVNGIWLHVVKLRNYYEYFWVFHSCSIAASMQRNVQSLVGSLPKVLAFLLSICNDSLTYMNRKLFNNCIIAFPLYFQITCTLISPFPLAPFFLSKLWNDMTVLLST